jgi:hypothetical protein
MTYPVSHATRGREMQSHKIMRFEGEWDHLAFRDRKVVDLDGVDFVGVRSGSGNSLG